jgi:hypothetical protein
MTAIQGKYTVTFTSHERWMHKCDTGEFYFSKGVFECMEELRKDIQTEIEKDEFGTFDVIKYLKDRRGGDSQA